MKSLIITEGGLDQVLLDGILRAEPRLRGRYATVAAGGESSAISLARSYLATSDARVALIADADTRDPDEVPRKQSALAGTLGAVATADRYLVLLAVPAIEILLFADRELAECLFDRKMADAEWADAQTNPKLALGKLIQGTSTRVINLSKVERLLRRHDLKTLLPRTIHPEDRGVCASRRVESTAGPRPTLLHVRVRALDVVRDQQTHSHCFGPITFDALRVGRRISSRKAVRRVSRKTPDLE